MVFEETKSESKFDLYKKKNIRIIYMDIHILLKKSWFKDPSRFKDINKPIKNIKY